MLYSCRMRRKRLIRPTDPVPIVGLIRCVKHRIRHCAPIAGCGTGCRPDKTRQASHQAWCTDCRMLSSLQRNTGPRFARQRLFNSR
ncbi:hypothetical protein HMPREF9542_01773 [Escherichia coli MS 117-3]|nr:hypothetical protein HMPREF9542_01773 [Escherichia coli MS 117-3]